MAAVIEPTLRFHESGVTGAGPGLWYGPDAPNGDAADWLRAPVGSIYFYKPSGSAATAYVKTANNAADADWVSVAGTAANGALIGGLGTSAAPISTASANKNFLQYYVASTATTAGSDTRAAYLRLYLNGATTGGGDALRAFTTVGAAVGTAHGAHISLSHGASGSLSGAGDAVRATLQLKAGVATGTLSALHGEIWLDTATSEPPASSHGILRLGVGGDVTKVATVTNLLLVDGVQVSAASSSVAHMVTTGAADSTSDTEIRISINGTSYWLLATATPPAA